MREILFKAKRLDNEEWVEGSLVVIHEEDYRIATKADVEWSYTDRDNYDGVMTCVVPKTICQYTGLTDKNGNKIWENDVVRKSDTNALGWGRVRNCKISFDKLGYWLLTTQYGDGYWLGEFNAEQLEVIGNIFDNPELMERMG